MSEEFTPITTQAEFDAAIRERINRQNEKHKNELNEIREKYADYDALKEASSGYQIQIDDLTAKLQEANEKVVGYDSQIAQMNSQIDVYKLDIAKHKVASEFALSNDAIDFLSGTSEDELRTNAEKLSKLTASCVAPLAGNNPVGTNSKDAALKELATQLFEGGR